MSFLSMVAGVNNESDGLTVKSLSVAATTYRVTVGVPLTLRRMAVPGVSLVTRSQFAFGGYV
jgi:hypothetical protein